MKIYLSMHSARFRATLFSTLVAPLAARPAGQLLIVHFAVKLFVLFSVSGKTLALARGSTLDSHRGSVYSKKKELLSGTLFLL